MRSGAELRFRVESSKVALLYPSANANVSHKFYFRQEQHVAESFSSASMLLCTVNVGVHNKKHTRSTTDW